MRIVFCIVITFLPTFAGAALPIEYNAESGIAIESPTIQGWLESGIDGQVTVGAVEDAGMQAWRIEDNTNSNSPRYAISLATEDFRGMYQDGWEFSFVVRGVAGDPSSNICGFCGWGLTVDRDPGWGLTGRERVGFSIARIDKDDSFEVLPIHGGVINLGPGSADVFHTIHCIGRADSPLYEFYLDGEFEGLFDIRDGGSNSSFDNQIRFTSGSTAGTGRITYWNLVKLTVPAITILQTDGTTAVAEGSPGEDTYIIYLNQEPGSSVSLFVDPNGAGDGSGMEIDLGAGPGTGITLLWTPVNWSERKTVTVRAVDDERGEGPHEAVIRHVVDSEDVYYDGFQAVDVIVEISDDEPYCGDDNTFYLNADIDRDCFVNLYDMAILALDWLTCSDPANEACKQYLPPEPPKKIIVFDSQYDTRYPVYRQPSIIVTEGGTVLTFCQGREGRSDSAENDVVLKRSFDGGRTWGPLQLLHDAGDDNLNNVQSVQVRETGRIFVMYGRFPQGCHTSCVEPGYYSPEDDRHHRTYLMYSDDEGETWSEPQDITQTVREPTDQYYSAPGNGFGIQLRRDPHAGRIIMPFQSRWVSKPRNDRSVFSDDYGLTWQVGGYPSTDFISARPDELQMVELSDGSVLMNTRSSSGHRRLTASSGDGGETWGQITAAEQLIEPPAMGTIIRYSDPLDGEVSRILFANPASTSGRHTGTVRLSYDECRSWTVSKVIETGYYGYSCLTVLPDGGIGVLYESDGNFHTMMLAVLSLRWLTDGED